jgi:hypothetical protein
MATYQTLVTNGRQNPFTWSQGVKNEIAQYGTTLEQQITGIDWGKEVLSRFKFGQSRTAELSRRYMMIEDDMSFMEPIFLERQLPFPEYLVECGYHAMTREIINRGVPQVRSDEEAHDAINPLSTHGDDEQLVKRGALEGMLDKYGKHFSAKYEIPRVGGGVFNVSVISGKMFYSRTDAPYEIMCGALRDEDDDTTDPLPYQTDEQLMIHLAKVIAKAQEEA